MSRIEKTARTAKAGAHALRKALSTALHGGQARVKDMVDSSGRRADDSLEGVEQAIVRFLDAIAQRGSGYARDAGGRLSAAEARLFPRRRRPPVATALVGVGLGVLLSLLFMTPAANRK
jgi:hypothetical protein